MTDTPPPGNGDQDEGRGPKEPTTDTPPPGEENRGAADSGDGAAAGGDPGARTGGDGPSRDVNRAWDEVGQHFADLGRTIARNQQREAGTAPADGAEGARSGGPARQLIDALDDAFTAMGDTVRDESFQREAKGTLNALGAALGVTFTELGQQLQERFDRPSRQ